MAEEMIVHEISKFDFHNVPLLPASVALRKICSKYGVLYDESKEEILNLNSFKENDLICVGSKIKIPSRLIGEATTDQIRTTSNKQIEEMAKTIGRNKGYGCREKDDCQSCLCRAVDCIPYEIAQILFASGYRKQSEVAQEIFAEIEILLSANQSSELRAGSVEWFDYFDHHLEEDLAELKKKYTEEER